MSNNYDDWHIRLLEAEEDDLQRANLQPYMLKGATAAQEEALRTLAEQSGFKDLRGFHMWMKAADLTYYDLIKVASP